MLRDFTYIDDVVECISLCSEKPLNLVNKSKSYCSNSIVQHQILNVGNEINKINGIYKYS